MAEVSRAELVARLAEVSHLTYERQKHRDHGVPLDQLSLAVTDHDRERAEDTVAELERLGLYKADDGVEDVEHAAGPAEHLPESEPEPEPDPAPRGRFNEPVTDVWGQPLSSKRRRRNR